MLRFAVLLSCLAIMVHSFLQAGVAVGLPGYTGVPSVYKVPVHHHPAQSEYPPPLFYGDTFSPVLGYTNPQSYQRHPQHSEPILQAVQHPYGELGTGLADREEAVLPVPNSSLEPVALPVLHNSIQEKQTDQTDDPWEPEAEFHTTVDRDFQPSTNPLYHTPNVPFISADVQNLTSVPALTFRLEREADNRESGLSDYSSFSSNQDQKVGLEDNPALNKDKLLAYSLYRQQWTSSGQKKLVVDASKALKEHKRRHRPDRRVAASWPGPPALSPDPLYSLLTLGPNGPVMPFLGSFVSDMRSLLATPLLPRAGSNVMLSMREILHNMQHAQGDQRFDIYDWVPLFAVLFGSALLLNGLFPNSLQLGGGLSLGRSEGASQTGDMMDMAMAQLENGVLLLSSIRAGGACSARVACRLAHITSQTGAESRNIIMEAVTVLVPGKYSNFTEGFTSALLDGNQTGCAAQCDKCLVI